MEEFMSRKHTGLRNRHRRGHGLSTYAKKGKRRNADTYGTCVQGKRVGTEIIAGRVMQYQFGLTNER